MKCDESFNTCRQILPQKHLGMCCVHVRKICTKHALFLRIMCFTLGIILYIQVHLGLGMEKKWTKDPR